ncbi:MAG: membrane dipeptidase, partial [Pseudomonadota bacterium]|nr:membrane dipeptidase [Pseudomonadota bacterium]
EIPPAPYKFPKGIETPRTLHNLTARLLERGFSELDIRKIWGLNWMRVYREVWAGKICERYVTVVTANHRIPGQIEHILKR